MANGNGFVQQIIDAENQQMQQQQQIQQPQELQQQQLNLRTITIDPVKYAQKLPLFDGRTENLKSFLDVVDVMVPTLQTYDLESQRIVANIIKTKLTGRAQLIININNHLQTWNEIKYILVSNFSDKKSSFQLLDELKLTKFENSVIDFYNTLQKKLQNLNLKSELEGRREDCETNKRIALEIFKHKMIEPVKSVLFSRNPQSMEGALSILVEGNYLNYGNKRNFSKNQNPNFQAQLPNSNVPPNHNHPFNATQNSVQSRIHRFGQPTPMDVDNSGQYIRTNSNFRQSASEEQTKNSLILE